MNGRAHDASSRERDGGQVAGPLASWSLVAVAFRLPYLTERSLWYDEASSWQTAKFPWAELMRASG